MIGIHAPNDVQYGNSKEGDKIISLLKQIYDKLNANYIVFHNHVIKEWKGAPWPLLLILIDFEESKKFLRQFKNIQMSIFHEGKRKELRVAPAFPWEVCGPRWSYELK